MLAERLGVAARALLGPQLTLHAVDPRGIDPGRAQERLGGEPVVAFLVLRRDAALVGEPDLDAVPVLQRIGEQFVGALRRRAAGEREVRDAALLAGASRAARAISTAARAAVASASANVVRRVIC